MTRTKIGVNYGLTEAYAHSAVDCLLTYYARLRVAYVLSSRDVIKTLPTARILVGTFTNGSLSHCPGERVEFYGRDLLL